MITIQQVLRQFAVKNIEVHEILIHEATELLRRIEANLLTVTLGRFVRYNAVIKVETHDDCDTPVVQRETNFEASLLTVGAMLTELLNFLGIPTALLSRTGQCGP